MNNLRWWLWVLTLIPIIGFSYDIPDQNKADRILALSHKGRQYYSQLDVDANKNTQGKKNVYKDEYGVVILVGNKALLEVLQVANRIAYHNDQSRLEITPHISLVQGVYRGNKLSQLKDSVLKVSSMTPSESITMYNQFVQVGSNIFLDVKIGKNFFDKLTTYLTKAVQPDAPMKQTLDDIKSGVADLREMHDGGAWRDFNLPYNNRPHITVVYDRNNQEVLNQMNSLMTESSLSFKPTEISIYRIDEAGNLYGDPICQHSFINE